MLLLVVGAGLLLVSSSLTWLTASTAVAGALVVLDGGACLPALRAVGVLALAGGGGILAARGRWRAVIGVILATAAALGLLALIGAVRSQFAGVVAALPPAVDGSAAVAASVSTTGPVLAGVGYVAIVCGGVLAVITASSSQGLSSRFERTATPVATDDSAALWSALDRGDDPTAEPADR